MLQTLSEVQTGVRKGMSMERKVCRARKLIRLNSWKDKASLSLSKTNKPEYNLYFRLAS
jgi:hypothetical protein